MYRLSLQVSRYFDFVASKLKNGVKFYQKMNVLLSEHFVFNKNFILNITTTKRIFSSLEFPRSVGVGIICILHNVIDAHIGDTS